MPAADELFLPLEAFGDNHPLAVDLGLSVKWASYNVGATSPEENGGYYAWGETEEKDIYDHSTYKYHGENSKYTDNNVVLDPEDDVAHVLGGDGWRMPTIDEIKELCQNCSWEGVVMNNGIKSFIITSPMGIPYSFPAKTVKLLTFTIGQIH